MEYFDCNEYSLKRLAGAGAFGTVVLAMEKRTNERVAIKRIGEIDKLNHCTVKVLREMHLLFSLRHNNIVSLENLTVVNKHLYIVTEYCEYSLCTIIEEKDVRLGIFKESSDFISVLFQLLQAVNFLHSVGVLHRDIKPGNVLLDNKMNLKLCDFGLARVVGVSNNKEEIDSEPLTEYMVTRWYRAPELVLNPGKYGTKSDIWSVACTFAELISQEILFPATSTIDQIRVIVQTFGTPSREDMDFEMSERAIRFLNSLSGSNKASLRLEKMLMKADSTHAQMPDLLLDMLQFNPSLRVSAADSLTRSMFDEFRSTANAPSSSLSSSSTISWDRYNTCLERLSSTKTSDERLDVITGEVAYIVSKLQTERRLADGEGGTGSSFGQKCRAVFNHVVAASPFSESDGDDTDNESLSDRLFSAVKFTWDSMSTLSSVSEDSKTQATMNKSHRKIAPMKVKLGSKIVVKLKPRLLLMKKQMDRPRMRRSKKCEDTVKEDCGSDERIDVSKDATRSSIAIPQPVHSKHINTSNPFRSETVLLA